MCIPQTLKAPFTLKFLRTLTCQVTMVSICVKISSPKANVKGPLCE